MIGITGGIGSGKSVVSRILRLRGCSVYDCDFEAKRIMDTSEEVLLALHERFGDEVCPPGGPISRPALARHVFGDAAHREWLNAMVHRLVRMDLLAWCERESALKDCQCYVESAIMASSGLAELCSEVWVVDAPEEVRTERVRTRDNLGIEEIARRLEAQKMEMSLLENKKIKIRKILNDNVEPLLEQI